MKKIVAKVCLLAFTLAMFSNCASVNRAQSFNGLKVTGEVPATHYSVSVSGLYLVLTMPLITGDPEKEGMFNFTFGDDTVNLESSVDFLTRTAKAEGSSEIVDLQSSAVQQMIPFPLPFILWNKAILVSGTGVKKEK